MIRIEVQQDPNAEGIIWEIDGPWDADAAASLVEGIDETIKQADQLGLTLWQAMAPKASTSMIEFQMLGRPKFARRLTFKVTFRRGDGRQPTSRGAQGYFEQGAAAREQNGPGHG